MRETTREQGSSGRSCRLYKRLSNGETRVRQDNLTSDHRFIVDDQGRLEISRAVFWGFPYNTDHERKVWITRHQSDRFPVTRGNAAVIVGNHGVWIEHKKTDFLDVRGVKETEGHDLVIFHYLEVLAFRKTDQTFVEM